MDDNLAEEMVKILKMEDQEEQSVAIARILGFLELLPVSETRHMPLIIEIINKAYEVLPSSNLPMNVSKKYNLSRRTRKISFGGEVRHSFTHSGRISEEGLLQKKREASSLIIYNLDVKTKFTPKECLLELRENNTRRSSFLPCNITNQIKDIQLKSTDRKFTKVDISIEQILQDPSCLEIYLN